jgi:hypothetical protein
MSVTKPTLKPEPLDDALVVLLVGAAALPPLVLLVELLLVVLLLLLPHAASPRANTTASAPRPDGLILPDTTISFPQQRVGNHNPPSGLDASGLTWF